MNDEENMNNENSTIDIGPVTSVETKIDDASSSVTEEKKSSISQKDMEGLSIAALIIGVTSILAVFKPGASVICGVLAIVLGAVSNKRGNKTYSKVAIICGIVGIVLSILLILFIVLVARWLVTAAASASGAN